VTVFAAASLKNALDEVDLAFESLGHGTARASYASSSVIARQIAAGAPADVFISADTDWMDDLDRRGLIVKASRHNLLSNRLVLVAPKDSQLRLRLAPGMKLAAALGGGRLAIGGPDVPAGRYAEAALRSLGVWPSVKDHLAPGENVRATLAFVARGEAPLGIVYETDALIEPAVRVVGVFPASSHAPIIYPAALVAASRNPAARAYLDFLRRPPARAIFRRYGFGTAP
jgi:molybdate transport system substrate-binding protein